MHTYIICNTLISFHPFFIFLSANPSLSWPPMKPLTVCYNAICWLWLLLPNSEGGGWGWGVAGGGAGTDKICWRSVEARPTSWPLLVCLTYGHLVPRAAWRSRQTVPMARLWGWLYNQPVLPSPWLFVVLILNLRLCIACRAVFEKLQFWINLVNKNTSSWKRDSSTYAHLKKEKRDFFLFGL